MDKADHAGVVAFNRAPNLECKNMKKMAFIHARIGHAKKLTGMCSSGWLRGQGGRSGKRKKGLKRGQTSWACKEADGEAHQRVAKTLLTWIREVKRRGHQEGKCCGPAKKLARRYSSGWLM